MDVAGASEDGVGAFWGLDGAVVILEDTAVFEVEGEGFAVIDDIEG